MRLSDREGGPSGPLSLSRYVRVSWVDDFERSKVRAPVGTDVPSSVFEWALVVDVRQVSALLTQACPARNLLLQVLLGELPNRIDRASRHATSATNDERVHMRYSSRCRSDAEKLNRQSIHPAPLSLVRHIQCPQCRWINVQEIPRRI
jgi:hypothetical protein